MVFFLLYLNHPCSSHANTSMSRSVSKYPGIVFYSNINKYVQHLTITFKPCLYSCYIKLTWNVQANQLSLYSVMFPISITCILKQTHVKGSFRCIHLYTNFNYDADDYIYDIIVEIPSTIRSQFYINLKARYQMRPDFTLSSVNGLRALKVPAAILRVE